MANALTESSLKAILINREKGLHPNLQVLAFKKMTQMDGFFQITLSDRSFYDNYCITTPASEAFFGTMVAHNTIIKLLGYHFSVLDGRLVLVINKFVAVISPGSVIGTPIQRIVQDAPTDNENVNLGLDDVKKLGEITIGENGKVRGVVQAKSGLRYIIAKNQQPNFYLMTFEIEDESGLIKVSAYDN